MRIEIILGIIRRNSIGKQLLISSTIPLGALKNVRESAKLFKGTAHEDDWVFYHDALSLMTVGATIA